MSNVINLNELYTYSMNEMSDREVLDYLKNLDRVNYDYGLLDCIPRARINEKFHLELDYNSESLRYADLLNEKYFSIDTLRSDLEEYKSYILCNIHDYSIDNSHILADFSDYKSDKLTRYIIDSLTVSDKHSIDQALYVFNLLKYNFDVDRIIQAVINLRNNQK